MTDSDYDNFQKLIKNFLNYRDSLDEKRMGWRISDYRCNHENEVIYSESSWGSKLQISDMHMKNCVELRMLISNLTRSAVINDDNVKNVARIIFRELENYGCYSMCDDTFAQIIDMLKKQGMYGSCLIKLANATKIDELNFKE